MTEQEKQEWREMMRREHDEKFRSIRAYMEAKQAQEEEGK